MAGGEPAKSEFTTILSSLNRKFDLIHVKWTEEKCFEVKFRTQIKKDSEDFNGLCDEWVDLFSNVTSTVWVKKISNTGPKIRFRKQYQCWPQIGKDVQKELLFDARRCKGTLDMKVLTDNPLTRRKNKHIRLGLNVVVKINFTHLHKVVTTVPYAYFIHQCEPQLELPKLAAQSNEKLSQKVAEIVQKGLIASPKVVNIQLPEDQETQLTTDLHSSHQQLANPQITTNSQLVEITNPQIENLQITNSQIANLQIINPQLTNPQITNTLIANPHIIQKSEDNQIIHQNQLQLLNMEQVTLNQILPIQTGTDLKLQVQQQLPQLTQVVVTTPQLDMSEPLLMCQPTLMFDPTQVIPVTTHHIPHHFVQVHSNISNQHGHYL